METCVWRTPSCTETVLPVIWLMRFAVQTRTRTRRHRSPQGVISLRLTRSERARGLRDTQLTVHTVWVIFSPVEGAGLNWGDPTPQSGAGVCMRMRVAGT